MSLQVSATQIAGPLVLEPKVHTDGRGHFFEAFSAATFREALQVHGQHDWVEFVQDNESFSKPGVLRGIHLQLPPHAQGKLVRVIAGSVWDVAVDLRPASPTFLRSVGVLLSESNHRQLWIPEGFGHGFLALDQGARLLYKVTRRYRPEAERTLPWNSPVLGVQWPLQGREPIVSEKDNPRGLDVEVTMKELLGTLDD